MKKTSPFILMIPCVIFAVLILFACSKPQHKDAPAAENTPTAEIQTPVLIEGKKEPLELLYNTISNPGTQTQNGFYRSVDTGESFSNIVYIDFSSQRMVYLCAQPNCLHRTPDCTSYLDSELSRGGFTACADSLYFFSPNGEIWRMNLDGSEREKIYTGAAAANLNTDLAYDGDNLFWIQTIPSGEKSTSRLVCLNLSDYNLQELCTFDETVSIAAVQDRNIVLQHRFTDETMSVGKFDVDTQQETRIYTDENASAKYGLVDLTRYVYIDYTDKSVKEIIFGEQNPITLLENLDMNENTPIYVNELRDDHFAFTIHRPNGDNSYMIHDYYSIDLTTGNMVNQLPVIDNMGEETSAEIVADMQDAYLVRCGIQSVTYHTVMDDGTIQQREGPFAQYGMISKENYWKGISEYTAIQSDVNL